MNRNRFSIFRWVVIGVMVGGATRTSSGQEMLWKTFGDHAYQKLGFTVAGVGDLTADGIPDILVGQPFDAAKSAFQKEL